MAQVAQNICPLDATRLAPKLYQGSMPPLGPTVRACGFDVLVLAAQEYQPLSRYFPGVRVIRAQLDDSGKRMTEAEQVQALQAGAQVARELERGSRVLTTCAAGRNRSGFVNGYALWFLTGIAGQQIVTLIRAYRPHALTNRDFVAVLRALPARRAR